MSTLNLGSNKNQRVFLTKDSKLVNSKNKLDIILSPEFYWVRVFDIPVKTVNQARYVLPSLFEDILHTVSELSYQVIKLEDNRFLCFAYVNRVVYEAIKRSVGSLSSVNAVYFAQNECQEFSNFKVQENYFMYTEDGILVKVPKTLANPNSIELNEKIDNLVFSSTKVNIKLYNNLLTNKQVYMIIFLALAFSCINIYKIFDYKKSESSISKQIEQIRENSNIPNSMIRANSIIKGLKTRVDKEFNKREALEYFLQNKSIKVSKLELDKNIVELFFTNQNSETIKNIISKKYKIISSRTVGADFVVRVKI